MNKQIISSVFLMMALVGCSSKETVPAKVQPEEKLVKSVTGREVELTDLAGSPKIKTVTTEFVDSIEIAIEIRQGNEVRYFTARGLKNYDSDNAVQYQEATARPQVFDNEKVKYQTSTVKTYLADVKAELKVRHFFEFYRCVSSKFTQRFAFKNLENPYAFRIGQMFSSEIETNWTIYLVVEPNTEKLLGVAGTSDTFKQGGIRYSSISARNGYLFGIATDFATTVGAFGAFCGENYRLITGQVSPSIYLPVYNPAIDVEASRRIDYQYSEYAKNESTFFAYDSLVPPFSDLPMSSRPFIPSENQINELINLIKSGELK